MPLILLFLFVAVPIAEIALLIKVGEAIGVLWTIILVIITALIGTAMLRSQGISVLTRAQQAVQEGRLPMDSVVDGVCLLLAGAFLLTPGLITDTIGFLLFVPALRRGLAHWIFARLLKDADVSVSVFGTKASNSQRPPQADSGIVIDGEFEHINDSEDKPAPQPANTSTASRTKRSPWKQS